MFMETKAQPFFRSRPPRGGRGLKYLHGLVGDGEQPVALLAEGVDRNTRLLTTPGSSAASPSSRRAWIEIAEPPARWR